MVTWKGYSTKKNKQKDLFFVLRIKNNQTFGIDSHQQIRLRIVIPIPLRIDGIYRKANTQYLVSRTKFGIKPEFSYEGKVIRPIPLMVE